MTVARPYWAVWEAGKGSLVRGVWGFHALLIVFIDVDKLLIW